MIWALCASMMRPHRLYAASVLRVGVGTLILLFVVEHVNSIQFMWGPQGAVDLDLYRTFAHASSWLLFSLNGSAAATYWWFFLTFVAALLFTFGIWVRITTPLLTYCVFSVFIRDEFALDGGHNLIILTLLYLCFVRSDRYLTITAKRFWSDEASIAKHWVPILIHNVAMFLILAQMSVVYFWSGTDKIMGHKWQDGTALYYIMRVDTFQLPGISHYIYDSATLVTLLTYGTICFEISFAVLLWNRRLRSALYLGAICMHGGIAVFMGLTYFSATMLVLDTVIFDDNAYRRAVHLVRHIVVSLPFKLWPAPVS